MAPVTEGIGRQVDYWLTVYRAPGGARRSRSFVAPLFYVVAMGVLLGGFIEADPDELEGATSYLAFVVPGLVAAHAMQTAVGETTYPVMGMIKWQRVYDSMLATPLAVPRPGHRPPRVRAVPAGHDVRGLHAGAGAVRRLRDAGGGRSWRSSRRCWSAWRSRSLVYALTRGCTSRRASACCSGSGVFPLFLFSGAFFPISNLGAVGAWVARLTPLWHGVNLSRMFMLDNVDWSVAAINVAGPARADRRRLVLVGLRPEKRLVSLIDHLADVPRSVVDGRRPGAAADRRRGGPAARAAQLHRLPQGLEAVPHRVPRAVLLPALDRHRRRPADRHASSSTASRSRYAEFVAPGMLAASAFNGALIDATFNVFFKLKFDKLYDQMLATPLTTSDIARGEIAWGQLRGGVYSAAFLVVMGAMGLRALVVGGARAPGGDADRVRVRGGLHGG